MLKFWFSDKNASLIDGTGWRGGSVSQPVKVRSADHAATVSAITRRGCTLEEKCWY